MVYVSMNVLHKVVADFACHGIHFSLVQPYGLCFNECVVQSLKNAQSRIRFCTPWCTKSDTTLFHIPYGWTREKCT